MKEATFGGILIFASIAQGIKVTKLEVPRYLATGESAILKCLFSLENEKLYSLNWWKDDRQFYQFIPKNDPQQIVYRIPGVQVNSVKSNLHWVELINIKASSGGEYRCEVVGEAPTFNTQIRAANLTIIDPPDGPPVVSGLKQIYHPGEVVKLNCTSYRSRPAPKLLWEVFSTGLSLASALPPSSKPKHDDESSFLAPSYLISSSSFSSSDDDSQSASKHLASSSKMQNSPLVLPMVEKLNFNPISNISPNKYLPYTITRKHRHTLYASPLLTSSFKDHAPLLKSIKYKCQKNKSDKLARTRSSSSKNKRRRRNRRDTSQFRGRNPNRTSNSSNYTEIVDQYVIPYPTQTTSEEGGEDVYSSTLGIQFPASLGQTANGEFTLRCRASLSATHHWATEVRVRTASSPVADPQQLPTLHDTGAPRGTAARRTGIDIIVCCHFLCSIFNTIMRNYYCN